MTKLLRRHIQGRSQLFRVTPQMRSVAKQLMVYETTAYKSSAAPPQRVFNFNEKLRPHLSTLYGIAGYRSLLSRALVMADAEVPWLRGMHMTADGSLEGLETLKEHLDPDEILEGKIALLSQLLGSLVAYIGQGLTLRLLSEVFPQMSLKKMDLGDGGEK